MDWGTRKVAWVQSSDLQEAINAFEKGEVDGLGISSYKGFSGSDISFLSQISEKLTGLLLPLAGEYDLGILSSLGKLKYLRVLDTNQSLDLRHLRCLEELGLDWHSSVYLPDVDVPLRSLGLRGYKAKSKDLTELPAYRGLEDLELIQGNLTSLAGVERFTSLKKGDFAYMTKLESIKNLAKTPVETVMFDSCKKVAGDLPLLSKCPNLKMLGFHGGGELESLKFLNSFKSLEEFRFVRTKIKDGDMTPLLKLKCVNFTKQQGYSHTPEQIREMIGAPPFVWDQTNKK
jgi:hypothetical protein